MTCTNRRAFLVGTAVLSLLLVAGLGCEEIGSDNDNDNEFNATNVECSSVGTLSGSINEDTTLDPAEHDCLIVSDGITVSGAHLTIEAGVMLEFERDTGLDVDGGTMSIEGTADNPVILTGTEKQPGWWMGVRFKVTDSSANQINHAVIEYGGGAEFRRADSAANLVLIQNQGTPQVAIDNTVLRYSGSVGLLAEWAAEITSFENNTLTDNDGAAAMMAARTVGMLGDTSSFEGNQQEYVEVYTRRVKNGRNTSGREHIWSDLGVPYRITSDIEIAQDHHVHIEAGATLEFAENTGFSTDSGSMSAEGTDNDPVVFTGIEKTPGWWDGVEFRGSAPGNYLDYAVIEYGGGDEFRRADGPANLVINEQRGEPELSIENTTLRHSETVGLLVESDAVVTSFQGNTLTNNAEGVAVVDAHHLDIVTDSSSSYDGNDEDYLWVMGGDLEGGDIGTDEHVWSDIGISYGIINDIRVDSGAHLDIEPGATLAFEEDIGLNVYRGTLSAVGTDTDPVVFKSLGDDSSGYWKGLQFRQTDSDENRLEHVVITGGGGDTFDRMNEPAALAYNARAGSPRADLVDVEITDFSPGVAVAYEDDSSIGECSGLTGFGPGDVAADGRDEFISECGL